MPVSFFVTMTASSGIFGFEGFMNVLPLQGAGLFPACHQPDRPLPAGIVPAFGREGACGDTFTPGQSRMPLLKKHFLIRLFALLPALFPFAEKVASAEVSLNPPAMTAFSPAIPGQTDMPVPLRYTPVIIRDSQETEEDAFIPPSGTDDERARVKAYKKKIESPDELARLKADSAVEHLRRQFRQWGLSEIPLNNIIQLDTYMFSHDDMVQAVINSEQDGLLPQAEVRYWPARNREAPETEFFKAETRAIPRDNHVVRGITEDLYKYTDWLKFLMALKTHEDIRQPLVVNMSIGVILAEHYNRGSDRRRQERVDFVDEQVRRPEVQQALAEWVETTRQAVEAGIFPVIAIGNEHCALPQDIRPSTPDWQVNMLGWSPHVIRVGAASENGTPGVYDDDTPTPYSSRGSRWKPTMTLSGESIPLASLNRLATGTSYVNPVAAVLIALQLHHNPVLTLPELETLSQEASLQVEAPEGAVGSGILVPERFLANLLPDRSP